MVHPVLLVGRAASHDNVEQDEDDGDQAADEDPDVEVGVVRMNPLLVVLGVVVVLGPLNGGVLGDEVTTRLITHG